MQMIYVGFDTRSGQIVSAHHGATNAEEARIASQRYAKMAPEHLAMLPLEADAMERGKHYKVDVERKMLVQTEANGGSSFSFGSTGRANSKS